MSDKSEKMIKIIKIVGVTAVVYLVFRYMLPLVTPFVFSYGTAVILKPSAEKIAGRLKVNWKGRRIGVPPCIVAVLELIAIMALVGFGIYAGGRRVYRQVVLLMEQLPLWLEHLDVWLTGMCHQMEMVMDLRENSMVFFIQDMVLNLGNSIKQGIMPYLMGNSVAAAQYLVGGVIITVLFIIGVMLFVQELDGIGIRMKASAFWPEYERIGSLFLMMGKAYFRAQGIILLFTMIICTVGLFFLKSPYYILAGIGLGILDALPIFGTGTVLIPWALLCFLQRQWSRGLAVIILYLVCYVQRQILEAKMLADRVGLSPLETLVSIYVGLQLFGIIGVVLGPIGTLIIKEFSH